MGRRFRFDLDYVTMTTIPRVFWVTDLTYEPFDGCGKIVEIHLDPCELPETILELSAHHLLKLIDHLTGCSLAAKHAPSRISKQESAPQ